MTENERPQVVVESGGSAAAAILAVGQKKSMAVGLALTFFFGPLGLLYATIPGALILIVLTVIIGLLTLGLGFFLGWIGAMIWAAVAINSHNSKIMKAYGNSISGSK